MKQITFLILGTFIFIISCSNNPQKLLNQTQIKMLGYESINYYQKAFYPNPMGTFDTLETSNLLSKNEKSLGGYDYITKSGGKDLVDIGGEFKSIIHSDKTVHLQVRDPRIMRYSPLTFLRQTDWKFVSDTILDEKKLSDYYRVEKDTIVGGNKIYTEQHIFINTSSKLLERFERRNYFKEKLSQTIVFEYSNYNYDKTGSKLTYNVPVDYTFSSGKNSKTCLKEGQEAPRFIGKDLQNNPFNLEDYHGNKVLLVFSTIRCGACIMTLEHFNQKDYHLSDKISAVYIYPIDKQKEVIEYVNKVTAPFPVISNAKEIGEIYGVSRFPSLFLIDEKGIIEKVSGYNKEFLESLKN